MITSEMNCWEDVERVVAELFGASDLANAWLNKKMVRFAGLSPVEAWQRGEQERVREMIWQAAAGFVF